MTKLTIASILACLLCGGAWAASADSPQAITITETTHGLSVTPSTLTVAGNGTTHLTVQAPFEVECSIVLPTNVKVVPADAASPMMNCSPGEAHQKAAITFSAAKKDDLSGRATVKLNLAPATGDDIPLGAFVVAPLALISLGLCFAQSRSSSSGAREAAENRKAAAGELDSVTSTLRDTKSRIAALAAASTRSQEASLPARVAPPVPARKSAQESFLAAATQWTAQFNQKGEHPPAEVTAGMNRIAALSSDVAAFYREVSTVTRVALNATDDLDPEQQDYPLQQAIENMVNLARLKCITPRTRDRLDTSVHEQRGVDHADAPQWHGLISRVVRRGLRTAQGGLICKAEVRVYD